MAFTLDDFEACYFVARGLGIWDRETLGHHLSELSSRCVQMYGRDPAGNCIEINWPDASLLGHEVKADMKRFEDIRPQSQENLKATLFAPGFVASEPAG